MKILGPTRNARLNEAMAIVYLLAGLFVLLSLGSYSYQDPSWDTATAAHARNLTGPIGARLADMSFQLLGLAAFAIPALIAMLGWKWLRSAEISAPVVRILASTVLVMSLCTAFALGPVWRPIDGMLSAGGLIGNLWAGYLIQNLNLAGAILTTAAAAILALYLVSTFSVAKLAQWFDKPIGWLQDFLHSCRKLYAAYSRRAAERAREKSELRAVKRAKEDQQRAAAGKARDLAQEPVALSSSPIVETLEDKPKRIRRAKSDEPPIVDTPPWETPEPIPADRIHDIPIHELEPVGPPSESIAAAPPSRPATKAVTAVSNHQWTLPPLDLLNEAPARNPYDSQELKEIAARIKSKFEEFNVTGSVTQINPGPVVTTFEFKPEAGVKYSRITTLSEDLCLGLQAESILIERIPGKPTVGIEVPNTKREVINLRQILESEEFTGSQSPLTIPLGKDISGRIRVSALETMPHLLIAGSTGSGKSVMLNSMIMAILCKATPDEVRMIMIDPKRLEFGLYEGIPHLLTPVITDPKKATNALRNAVLEMERRLKLLASYGVRNMDQFNKKMRLLMQEPRSLFDTDDPQREEPQTLPYILILIDELADLMMLERANVEESVARLAQIGRAHV